MSPRRVSSVLLVVSLISLGLPNAFAEGPKAGPAPKQTKAPPPDDKLEKMKLPTPSYLPELAREFLRRRMQRHGRDMQELLFAVVLLQREVARDTATRIAEEPRLARPEIADEDILNKALPPRFFVLQDELRDRAKAVAEAARKGDDKQLGAAWSRLAETCVSCHSVYLNP